MISETEFLMLHHQQSAELRERAATYRLARSASPGARRIRVRWPRLSRRQQAGAAARAA